MLSGLIAGLGGASDGGGGAASGDVACSAVPVENASGSGGITNGDFIGNLRCNDSALSATDEDDCSPLLLRTGAAAAVTLVLLAAVVAAVVLLAVVEAEPESTMTALPMLTVLMTFSLSLICRCIVLPASRCVREPDG